MMRAQMVLLALLLVQRTTAPPAAPPQTGGNPPAAITITATDDGSSTPIEGVAITIASSPVRPVPPIALKSVTDQDGHVTVGGIAPGTYLVVATPPERFTPFVVGFTFSESQVRTVEVKAGERPTLHFVFKRPPAVSGLVQGPDGRPMAGVPIELMEWSATIHDRPVLAPIRTAVSDAAGRFMLDKLRPGRYYVRGRPPAPPGTPLNFVYAPGTPSVGESVPIQVEPGDEITVGLTLRSAATVRVSGRIVDANGKPATGVTVTLSALDRTTKPLSVPGVGPGSELSYAARTDDAGRFEMSSVFQGLYALRAIVRVGDNAPLGAAGVAEVDVRTSDVMVPDVPLQAPARLTGRFLFNGVEEPDPTRTQITMTPDDEHGHLRAGLASSDSWHADGRFEVDGIFGQERLTLRSPGAWFIDRATLEDGTDIATVPYAFAPGRTYPNARVWLSDRVASVTGPLPSWWDPHDGIAIVAFPEVAALRRPESRHVRLARVSVETKRFSILGLPAGQAYLIAAFTLPALPDWQTEDAYQLLTTVATRVMASDPEAYEVVLGAPLRR